MDEQASYRVCPERNVSAAFDRFFGTDTGGIERFFVTAIEPRRDARVRWRESIERRTVLAAQLKDSAAALLRGAWAVMQYLVQHAAARRAAATS